MPPDGSCRTCGRVIAEPPDTKVPWHFWLLLGALVVYLGWRAVQGFQWLIGNGHTIWAVVLGAVVLGLGGWAAWWKWGPGNDEPGNEGSDSSGADGLAS
jgi:hypothetical protein